MKKIFYLAAVAIATIFVSSCKDDPVGNLNGQGFGATKDSTVAVTDSSALSEYTIVMLASGGGDIDQDIVTENLTSLQKVVNTKGKVRLVGIYKPSKQFQGTLGEKGGTRFFELKMNEGITKEKVASDVETIYNTEETRKGLLGNQTFFNDIVNEKYASADYELNNPDNIAAMLKFLVKKAPAKKYILVTENHGGGWRFHLDKPLATASITTRAMVSDDNIAGHTTEISLDQFNAGVKKSGVKFDALFCNLCLMATLENLYGYSENFPICLASAETTTISNVGNLAERLAKLGGDASHDQLFNECSEWATTTDANTGHTEWTTCSTLKERGDNQFQDMGCYDLSKIGTLTAPLKAIANWLTNAMADGQLKKVVEKSVLTTLYTTRPDSDAIYLLRDEVNIKIGNIGGYGALTAEKMADLIVEGKSNKLYKDIDKSNDNLLWKYHDQQGKMDYGYPMAYFVWNTEQVARQKNMTKAADELSTLLNNYTTALKGMCRIKCSMDDFGGSTVNDTKYPKMDAYIWTSPTVQITSLSAKGFNANNVIDYSPWNGGMSLSEAIAIYNNTQFDQQTGWSKFLQNLDHNPSVLTSTFREIPVYYTVFGSLK